MEKDSNRENIITVVDIGNCQVRVGIGRATRGRHPELLGFGIVPTDGMRGGQVVSIEDLSAVIRQATEEASKASGTVPSVAHVGINSLGLEGKNTHGLLKFESSAVTITTQHIQHCIDEAVKAVRLDPGMDSIHRLVRYCTVDPKKEVDDPTFMQSTRLEIGLHIMAIPSVQITNTIQALNQAGLKVKNVNLNALAAAEAVLTPENREYGSLLVDIGSFTTVALIYQRGKLQGCISIPVGSDHFTRDLVMGLRTTIPDADRIKKELGLAQTLSGEENGDASDSEIPVENAGSGAPKLIRRQVVAAIMLPRAEDLVDGLNKGFQQNNVDPSLFSCAIFTGGGSLLPGLLPFLQESLDLPCRLGVPPVPENWRDDLCTPENASFVGLLIRTRVQMMRSVNPLSERQLTYGQPTSKVMDRLRKWWKVFSID